jgi:uncharacterized protein YccT (UPF0319 family)
MTQDCNLIRPPDIYYTAPLIVDLNALNDDINLQSPSYQVEKPSHPNKRQMKKKYTLGI